MSDTPESSAIDDKKETPTDPISETKTFFNALIYQLFHLFIIIIAGGAMLWSAKVAQTNLMPNNLDCEPYNISETIINNGEPIVVNIDVVKMKNDQGSNEIRSTKLVFPFKENFSIIRFGILGLESIRDWTDGPKSNVYTLYLGIIWQKMNSNYSGMMNSFYNFLNTTCSESVIIFLGPIIITIVLFVVGFVNGIYGTILWFLELYRLFSKQTGCFNKPIYDTEGNPILDSNKKPIYELGKIWTYEKGEMGRQWYWTIFYILMSLIFLGLVSLIIFCLLVRSSLSSLILPLLMVGKIQGSKDPTNNSYSFSSLLGNIIKYKTRVIMFIVSIFVISDAFSALGSLGALVAIIACIFIYFFYPEIYQQYKPGAEEVESTIGFASFEQYFKLCNKKEPEPIKCNIEKPKTWIEWFKSLFSGSSPAQTQMPITTTPITTTPITTSEIKEPSAPIYEAPSSYNETIVNDKPSPSYDEVASPDINTTIQNEMPVENEMPIQNEMPVKNEMPVENTSEEIPQIVPTPETPNTTTPDTSTEKQQQTGGSIKKNGGKKKI